MTLLYQLSKHLKFHKKKYSVACPFLTIFLVFGYLDEKLSLMFDTLQQGHAVVTCKTMLKGQFTLRYSMLH